MTKSASFLRRWLGTISTPLFSGMKRCLI